MDTRSYHFAEFELDLGAHQLRRLGEPVHLERRPFDLLVLLVTHHGQLVSRDEVIRQLWPGRVVIDFDTGLNTLVRKVRKSLGDSSDKPVFIETVAGRGYRFIAPLGERQAERTVSVPTAPQAKRRFSRNQMAAIVVLLIAVAALSVRQASLQEPARISIAVLPFENLTGSANFDFLAAGLAEETSISLSRIDLPNLVVIGGVSARAVSNATLPLQDIGRRHNIDFFVLSSLKLDQSRVRVSSRLLRLNDSTQIWSATFDREMTNILGLQSELSIAIAEQIRQRLSPDIAAAFDDRQTRNPEAYELYLKGRYEWGRFLPDSVPRALQFYKQAVDKDPRYALAWAGIAHALVTSSVTTEAQWESVMSDSKNALNNALEYGPDLAESQLALGSFHFFLQWDWPAAEAATRRAIQLDPNSAMAHMFLGIVLAQRGSFVEALDMVRRARELDPMFPLMFANSAVVALYAGDAESAHEFATQSIAINPGFWVGYAHLGNALQAQGNLEGALHAFTTAERLSGGNHSWSTSSRANLLATLGRRDEAHAVLRNLTAKVADQYVSPYSIAVIHAGLAENDAAFEWLERALAAHDFSIVGLSFDRRFEALRSDDRFESLLQRSRMQANRKIAEN